MGRRIIVGALALCLWSCGGAPAVTESANDARTFFRGKTMTYIVATDPGGGYDTYGRLVSKYLAKHLGLKTVVVKNVAGGGHVKGTNAIYVARADGLTIGTFNTGLLYGQLLRQPGLSSDLRRMSWIGKAGLEPRVLTVSAKSGFRSLDDIRNATRPLLIGMNGAGTESYYDAVLLARALGLRIKPVFGLSSRDAQLSMLRGEIDGELGSASTYKAFVRNGYGYTVLRIGESEDSDRRVPDASQLVASPEAKAIVDFVSALSRLLRWTAGPPGVPEDRLAVLRDAYISALSDEGFLTDARKLDLPIVPMDGATLAAEINRVLNASPELLELIGPAGQIKAGR